MDNALDVCGGIEGKYRVLVKGGLTRKQIAAYFRWSVPALAAWITKWNKAKEQSNDQEVPSS